MSVQANYDVWCDTPDCDNWAYGATDSNKIVARRKARKLGWKPYRLPDGSRGDCCPACAKRLTEGGER